MNKKVLIIVLSCIAVAGFSLYYFNPFRGTDEHTVIVPLNSTVVFSINIKALAKKADLDGKLKETKIYKEFMKKEDKQNEKTSKIIQAVIKAPRDCGIDLSSNIYVYVHEHKTMGSMTGMVFGMDSEKEFGDFMKKIPGVKEQIVDKKKYQFAEVDGGYWAWNDKGLLVLKKRYSFYGESESPDKYINELMSQQANKSMRVKKEFQRFCRQNDDIGFFMNYGRTMENYGRYGIFSSELEKIFQGLYMRGGMTFKDDKIVFKGQLDGKDESLKNFNILQQDGISSKGTRLLADKQTLAMVSVNIDIGKVLAIVKELAGKIAFGSALDRMELTEKDIEDMFTGEASFALLEIKQTQEPTMDYRMNPYTGMYETFDTFRMKTTPVFIVNIGIDDKRIVRKKIEKWFYTKPENGIYKLGGSYNPFYIVETDFGFAYVNDLALAERLQKNKVLKEPIPEVADLATSSPVALYGDLDLKHYPSHIVDEMSKDMDRKHPEAFPKFMEIFNNVQGSGGAKEFTYEVNLKKGDGNSLYRLLKQCDVLNFDEPKKEETINELDYMKSVPDYPPAAVEEMAPPEVAEPVR